MSEGYYWIKDGKNRPEVWFYLMQYGWFQPGNSLPVTLTAFRIREIEVISERLKPPGNLSQADRGWISDVGSLIKDKM